jgi:hypothetical protein
MNKPDTKAIRWRLYGQSGHDYDTSNGEVLKLCAELERLQNETDHLQKAIKEMRDIVERYVPEPGDLENCESDVQDLADRLMWHFNKITRFLLEGSQ